MITLAVVLGAAAIAEAQLPDGLPAAPPDGAPAGPVRLDANPCPAVKDATAAEACDTEFTPVGKDGSQIWQQVGGAEFGENGGLTAGSFTPYTVDFYTVDFYDQNYGFAAGAACPDDTAFDALDDCTRVPVIWAYTNRAGEGPLWREVYRGDEEGYIGAISIFKRAGALAVGGTGRYPYREFSIDSTTDPDSDPSGGGAVWQLGLNATGEETWRQYAQDELPTAPNLVTTAQSAEELAQGKADPLRSVATPMRALTALDCRLADETGTPVCVAGGIQQIFMWRDGEFGKAYGNGSPDADVPIQHNTVPEVLGTTEVSGAREFRFRVRSLNYVPGDGAAYSIVGATSGCCDPVPANDVARVLLFDGKRWYVRPLRPIWTTQQAPESTADSIYSIEPYVTGATVGGMGVRASGGPELPLEPASRLESSNFTTEGGLGFVVDVAVIVVAAMYPLVGPSIEPNLEDEALQPDLSDTRFVAGAGDSVGAPRPGLDTKQHGPDRIFDWAVGERRSTGQGIAYTSTTIPRGAHVPSPLNCSEYLNKELGVFDPSKCQAASAEDIQQRSRSSAVYLLDGYRLNSMTLDSASGAGWGVGDKGSIVSLGGDAGALGKEPKPPRVGSRAPSRDDGRAPYADASPAPLTAEPGTVPSLAAQTSTALDSRQLVTYGSPDTDRYAHTALSLDDVTSIVSSRDGSEAWALGSGLKPTGLVDTRKGGLTLYHFAGERWTRCDPVGVPGQLPADHACRGLAPLVRYTDKQGAFHPVRIQAATRVPLERDSDPANDDEFEVLALGSLYSPPGDDERCTVMRYSDGRWELDVEAMHQIDPAANPPFGEQCWRDVAFSSPGDGWIVRYSGDLYHFDGARWIDCAISPEGCGDDPAAPRLQGAVVEGFETAGDRTYLYGKRPADDQLPVNVLVSDDDGTAYPLILLRDRGGRWTDGSGPGEGGGGYDPGCASHDTQGACAAAADAPNSQIDALSVARNGDGSISGWASGLAGDLRTADLDERELTGASGLLFRLTRSDDGYDWEEWNEDDAATQNRPKLFAQLTTSPVLLTLPGERGDGEAMLLPTTTGISPVSDGPLLRFDPGEGEWGVQPTPFLLPPGDSRGHVGESARLRAVGADNTGGAWIAVRREFGESGGGSGHRASATFMYRLSDRAPESVFSDVPNPVDSGRVITSAAGGGDGSFWLATNSGTAYRYDRVTGWSAVDVPGWDAGRVITRPSVAHAVAVGPDGSGLLVGEDGRIADLSATGAVLDAATGVSCAASPPPCGTGRDLYSAAVAEDGSALVGGEARTLLWRGPQGGQFTAVTPPTAGLTADITSISMPRPEQAWLTTDNGQVFAGTLQGTDWAWELENVTADDVVLSTGTEGQRGLRGEAVPLNSIAVNRDGYGVAVGDQGLVLERSGQGDHPWRRIGELPLQSYQSAAVPATGTGEGALIGGQYGQILTLSRGHFAVAKQMDAWEPVSNSSWDSNYAPRSAVVGLALLPGQAPGQIEAWAAQQASIDAADRSPAPNALLHYTSAPEEPLLDGGTSRVEPLADTPRAAPGELRFAAFGKSECQQVIADTGGADLTQADPCPEITGTNLASEAILRGVMERLTGPDAPDFSIFTGDAVDAAGRSPRPLFEAVDRAAASPLARSQAHLRWSDVVADRFAEAGVPLLGAMGGQDLSRTPGGQSVSPIPWMEAMAEMPEPWGRGGSLPEQNGLSFVPVADGGLTGSGPDPGQASTHYAVDVERGGQKLARIVVVDTSLKSLTAATPLQNPREDQATWLRSVLCRPGEDTGQGAECTRVPGQRAIVVSESPTYSYGPSAQETMLASDSASFEALLFQYDVDLVVSGRLGWNGLYYTLDSGLHSPQPGDGYPSEPPAPVRPDGKLIPNVVASGAGGNFAAGSGSAADGFWRGYSMIHLDPETGEVTVEQRAQLDWLRLSAATHTLRAGRRLDLHAEGRETPGTDQPFRYDEISTPAITHRFELLEADPAQPWLPKQDAGSSDDGTETRSAASERLDEEDPCGPYVCLDPKVGTVDEAGSVHAGKGGYPRTFAVAAVTAGDKVATFPLVFEPRAAFKPKPAPSPPPVSVPPPAAPPAAAQPTTPSINLPAAPVLPVLTAQALAPPPAPPTPPAVTASTPLDLNVAPSALNAAPPTAVTQPPTPPVNPAPPGGARKEARQRQAAAQKSGADSAEEGSEAESTDLADKPPSAYGTAEMSRKPAEATRRSPQRSQPSFTPVSHTGQPSAWAHDALIGGGLGVAALILALGLRTARPTPRRREPELPAPAWARNPKR